MAIVLAPLDMDVPVLLSPRSVIRPGGAGVKTDMDIASRGL
jgi:hypothetical protein